MTSARMANGSKSSGSLTRLKEPRVEFKIVCADIFILKRCLVTAKFRDDRKLLDIPDVTLIISTVQNLKKKQCF